MFLGKAVFPVIAASALTLTATSQNPGSGVFNNPGSAAPPMAAVLQDDYEYDRSIGNSWLGGSVHTYATQMLALPQQSTYRLAHVAAELRGTANVLQTGGEVCELVGFATSVMNNGVLQRSGQHRVEMLGAVVVNTQFSSTTGFPQVLSQFELIPGGTTQLVPLGPISIAVHANVSCGFGRQVGWYLPAGTTAIAGALGHSASAHAFADAHVALALPGYGAGLAIAGEIFEQTVVSGFGFGAYGNSGLSGNAIYTLQPITLAFTVWSQTLGLTTTLCAWSAGQVLRSFY